MSELTPRQREIYDFITGTVEPVSLLTVREIGAKFDIRSPNGVRCHLKALQKKGYIKCDPCKKGIRILKATDERQPTRGLAGATDGGVLAEGDSRCCESCGREKPPF